MTRKIRLACVLCDRDDCDGIDRIPPGWQDVSFEQTYEQSIKPVAPNEPGSVLEWWTHLGTCPECSGSENWDTEGLYELDYACPYCGEEWQDWRTAPESNGDCPWCGRRNITPESYRRINNRDN